MCDFCEKEHRLQTTIGDDRLIIFLNGYYNDLLEIRLERGILGIARPIKIYHCPFCGKPLGKLKYNEV